MQIVLYCGAGRDLRLLQELLRYYTELGVTRSLVSLHLPLEDPRLVESLRATVSTAGATLANIWVDSGLNHKRRRQERLKVIERFCSPSDWIINADIDEFHEYPGKLTELIEMCSSEEFDFVCGSLCDRIAADGTLPNLEPSMLWEQFSVEADISKNILQADIRKIPVSRAWVAVSGGYHEVLDAQARACPLNIAFIKVHHFKWDSDVCRRLENRIRLMKAEGAPWWRESERFLSYLRANDGKLDMEDGRLNARRSAYSPRKARS